MNEICLENFLSNIHPYLEGDSFDEFLSELRKVPDYQSVFLSLLRENPAWLTEAQSSANGVSFLCQKLCINSGVSLPNKLELRRFEAGEKPTIKVTKYLRGELL